MRILVTGGAGYIGSVITEELLHKNHQVVVLDNLSKGHRAAVSADAFFVQEELLHEAAVTEILRRNSIEAVIHMAASSLVGESMREAGGYYKNNVTASLSLMNAMCAAGVRRIVLSSTAAVYGEPAHQPIEESDTTFPSNPYGETKLAVERAMVWYSRAHGLNFTSLRYFNAAGASTQFGEWHNPESHLIPAALRVALGSSPHLEIFGDDYPTRDGTCVRDYVHVVDLARAHILALESAGENKVYNLGCGGDGYSVQEVLETAREVTGHEIPSRVSARRAGDPAVLIASSTKIKSELGWNPEFQDLKKIVESAWHWLRRHPEGYENK